MALPDWINAFKEPETCIRYMSDCCYKYKVLHTYNSNPKRS
jgi:hypothetical protein